MAGQPNCWHDVSNVKHNRFLTPLNPCLNPSAAAAGLFVVVCCGLLLHFCCTAGGKTWTPAQLQKVPHSQPSRAWAWTLWEATLPLPQGFTGPLELVCKATDASYNTQPETANSVWNIRGLANNSWHCVTVQVADE